MALKQVYEHLAGRTSQRTALLAVLRAEGLLH
jgi:hypothetical protein